MNRFGCKIFIMKIKSDYQSDYQYVIFKNLQIRLSL